MALKEIPGTDRLRMSLEENDIRRGKFEEGIRKIAHSGNEQQQITPPVNLEAIKATGESQFRGIRVATQWPP
jgi:hypothetical protein